MAITFHFTLIHEVFAQYVTFNNGGKWDNILYFLRYNNFFA